MNRGAVLGTLIAVGSASMAIGAVGAPGGAGQGTQRVEIEKLKDNLFVLRGGGGNTAVFVQAKGVTVVDTKNPGWGQPVLDAIASLTDKPVTMIINTHSHGDHVSGNVEFAKNVTVIAHENTKANMARMASPPEFTAPGATPQPTIFDKHGGHGLPTRTFQDRLTLGEGADRVDLHYFGRGHTNGDTMVVFPAHATMHMGDLFPGKQLPIMDANNGGSGVAYPDTLMKVHGGVTDVQTIITGHGPSMTRADLQEFASFVREFVDAARAAKKAGQTPEAFAAGWTVPKRYAGYAAAQPARLQANAALIFQETK